MSGGAGGASPKSLVVRTAGARPAKGGTDGGAHGSLPCAGTEGATSRGAEAGDPRTVLRVVERPEEGGTGVSVTNGRGSVERGGRGALGMGVSVKKGTSVARDEVSSAERWALALGPDGAGSAGAATGVGGVAGRLDGALLGKGGGRGVTWAA